MATHCVLMNTAMRQKLKGLDMPQILFTNEYLGGLQGISVNSYSTTVFMVKDDQEPVFVINRNVDTGNSSGYLSDNVVDIQRITCRLIQTKVSIFIFMVALLTHLISLSG